MSLEGQQFMRIMLFFDLPTKSKEDRRRYTRFHTFLLREGYDMLQFSIYGRLCFGIDQAEKHLDRLKANLPPNGSVRTLTLTDKQYSRMQLWIGPQTTHEKKVNTQQLILL